jgi:hypothetical protein
MKSAGRGNSAGLDAGAGSQNRAFRRLIQLACTSRSRQLVCEATPAVWSAAMKWEAVDLLGWLFVRCNGAFGGTTLHSQVK